MHLAVVIPISSPTREYWVETTERMDEKYDTLEARAERIESIDEFDLDGDFAYFEASPAGFNDLVYGRIETEHGEHPVRTLFGKQYNQVQMNRLEEQQENKKPMRVAADGGTPNQDKMRDIDHEGPLEGVQETLERGG